ncbi:hypothetical protein BU24DRAFT_498030 [Aaosphaeria arxii CBS 175.79]|uniref:Uncharacterized protein n=1 Tax=Aaosphaeria arxii CBS 175.79 TaxID=1450172 RepID=A0A6A5X643_9PLEO|nr:uncharacterized protein BU24DRAFT_498030 [Aaosphaeria arxii CBS 175.79]KAF2008336.1 hypothetical protein BU24DRAFT_498030 [Aaosphaeria arxii CBS 175.79]
MNHTVQAGASASTEGPHNFHVGCWPMIQELSSQILHLRVNVCQANAAVETERGKSRHEIEKIQIELEHEKRTNEHLNQRLKDALSQLEETKVIATNYDERFKQMEEHNTSLQRKAHEITENSECVIENLQSQLAKLRGEDWKRPEGQSIGQLLVESATNRVLLQAREKLDDGKYDDILTELQRVSEYNIKYQMWVRDLKKENEELLKKVQSGKEELANLTKAVELNNEETVRPRKRTRKNKELVINTAI